MKVRVRLSQALNPGRFPDHHHLRGVEVNLPDNSQVKDLLSLLEIKDKQSIIVSINGEVKKWYDPIENGAFVDLHRPMAGG
jgi:sulfur carrier protein ThiS